jgi:hypothetical protein
MIIKLFKIKAVSGCIRHWVVLQLVVIAIVMVGMNAELNTNSKCLSSNLFKSDPISGNKRLSVWLHDGEVVKTKNPQALLFGIFTDNSAKGGIVEPT